MTDEQLNPVQIEDIDWREHFVPLSVLSNKRPEWLGLDADDLRILHNLLTKRIAICEGEGTATRILPRVADTSDGLRALASWAEGAARWAEKNPE